MARAPAQALLGDLEAVIMDHLWTHGFGDPKSVHTALGDSRGITINTVQSTLRRLFEKGLLTREKVSHAHVYRPRVTRDEFHRGALDRLLAQWMLGDTPAMVSAFVSIAERAGDDHLEELERLVLERRRRKEQNS